MISFIIMGHGQEAYKHFLDIKKYLEPIIYEDVEIIFCKNKNTLMEWNISVNPTYVVIVDGFFVTARERGAMSNDQIKEYLDFVSRNIQRKIFREQSRTSENQRDIILHSFG